MKHQRNLILFLLLAIAFTSLGYLLDHDLSYQKWWITAREFSIITFIVFVLQSAVYGLAIGVKNYLSHKLK